ncbi:MAG: hypothetical protein LBH66_08535 [Oscillospiraceae bacterium]|jgi:hypothetical protein|nr:hypothetical protein [Oscillospiraceae bacterium]
MNKRYAFIILVCAALLPLRVLAAAPTAAYAPWEVTGSRSAAAYLDGDSIPERVDASSSDGYTQLTITFGDGRAAEVPIGAGESIALVRLYSADLTGDGSSELIALTRDPPRDTYVVTIVGSPSGELSLLPVPAATDDAYRFQAVFARGYVLEISNQTYSFVQSVPVAAPETRAAYREDGTSPNTLVAAVSAFVDCTFAAYNGRPALELWQEITSNVQNQTLGYVVSTVVWEDGAPRLVGQRYAAKQQG